MLGELDVYLGLHFPTGKTVAPGELCSCSAGLVLGRSDAVRVLFFILNVVLLSLYGPRCALASPLDSGSLHNDVLSAGSC